MSALRKGENRLIEVELGRYDQPAEGFDRVTMRLGQYLDWLNLQRTPGGAESNRIDGKQLYLAQWRGADEVRSAPCMTPLDVELTDIGIRQVKSVQEVAMPPPAIRSLLEDEHLDLYQTSFFIGPHEAVSTP